MAIKCQVVGPDSNGTTIWDFVIWGQVTGWVPDTFTTASPNTRKPGVPTCS